VPKLRAERKSLTPDARFTDVVRFIRSGAFGWESFFAPLMDAVEGVDHYLVANDLPSYLDMQACPHELTPVFACCCTELRTDLSRSAQADPHRAAFDQVRCGAQ
jgi:hypothetical protein